MEWKVTFTCYETRSWPFIAIYRLTWLVLWMFLFPTLKWNFRQIFSHIFAKKFWSRTKQPLRELIHISNDVIYECPSIQCNTTFTITILYGPLTVRVVCHRSLWMMQSTPNLDPTLYMALNWPEVCKYVNFTFYATL